MEGRGDEGMEDWGGGKGMSAWDRGDENECMVIALRSLCIELRNWVYDISTCECGTIELI